MTQENTVLTKVLEYHPGIEFLAKVYKGTVYPKIYANRTQAYKAKEALGADWDVYHFARPFLVGRKITLDKSIP